MMHLKKTNSENPDFVNLVAQLDAYLKITDGDEHAFYDQYNGIEELNHVIVAYEDGVAQACGAMKAFSREAVEIKRMYTAPEYRGRGLASQVLKALEEWALELGYRKSMLETGRRQLEAVQFYPKNKYTQIPNYGQYAGRTNSVCFEKVLLPTD
jgi:GNAT superfamily N-acetyltransferase